MTEPRKVGDGTPEIALALACLRTGMLLEIYAPGPIDMAETLAAVAPELFRSAVAANWDALFAASGGPGFSDIVMISEGRVHVIQRVPNAPDTAVVAVGTATTNVGLVLASARRKALELEPR